MHSSLKNIKSVGFDLDQTLYPQKEEIDNIIRNGIAKAIFRKKPELKDVQNVRKIYDAEYKKTESGTKILRKIGFKYPEKIMYQCMSNPKILDYINKDEKLSEIIKALADKYWIFLITSSPRNLSISKLEKIGINFRLFNQSIFGDDEGFTSKTDVNVFLSFLQGSPYLPEQHVYIGDNLKSDILIPKSLGMRTIAVGKNIPEADFSVMRIYSISELLL